MVVSLLPALELTPQVLASTLAAKLAFPFYHLDSAADVHDRLGGALIHQQLDLLHLEIVALLNQLLDRWAK